MEIIIPEGSVSKIGSNKSLKSSKAYIQAIDSYKKICMKTYTNASSMALNSLKNENLAIYLDQFPVKEVFVLSKIISKYFYFKSLSIAPNDPNSIIYLTN